MRQVAYKGSDLARLSVVASGSCLVGLSVSKYLPVERMPIAHAACLDTNVVAVMTVRCLQAVVKAPNKVVLRFVTSHLPMSTSDKPLKVF